MVLDKGDVEARLAAELDVGTGQEIECGLLKAAFFGDGEEEAVGEVIDEIHDSGTIGECTMISMTLSKGDRSLNEWIGNLVML